MQPISSNLFPTAMAIPRIWWTPDIQHIFDDSNGEPAMYDGMKKREMILQKLKCWKKLYAPAHNSQEFTSADMQHIQMNVCVCVQAVVGVLLCMLFLQTSVAFCYFLASLCFTLYLHVQYTWLYSLLMLLYAMLLLLLFLCQFPPSRAYMEAICSVDSIFSHTRSKFFSIIAYTQQLHHFEQFRVSFAHKTPCSPTILFIRSVFPFSCFCFFFVLSDDYFAMEYKSYGKRLLVVFLH